MFVKEILWLIKYGVYFKRRGRRFLIENEVVMLEKILVILFKYLLSFYLLKVMERCNLFFLGFICFRGLLENILKDYFMEWFIRNYMDYEVNVVNCVCLLGKFYKFLRGIGYDSIIGVNKNEKLYDCEDMCNGLD